MIGKLPNRIHIKGAKDLAVCAQYIIQTQLNEASSSEIRENYSICMFMLAAYKAGNITYPTVIEILGHKDPPDFIIHTSTPNVRIGFEHTTATLGSYLVASKEMRRNKNIRGLEPSYYTSRNPLPVRSAFRGLIRERDGLTGRPFFGNAHLKNWVNFVFKAYKLKSQKSPRSSEHKYDKSELLIEVSIPNLIGDGHDKALTLLKEKVETESVNIPDIYHKLHIFSQDRVINDALRDTQIIKLSMKDVEILLKKLKSA